MKYIIIFISIGFIILIYSCSHTGINANLEIVNLTSAKNNVDIYSVVEAVKIKSVEYLDETYIVKKEETLYSIAWKTGKDYRTLAKINNLNSRDKLEVGKKIFLTRKSDFSNKKINNPTSNSKKSSDPINVKGDKIAEKISTDNSTSNSKKSSNPINAKSDKIAEKISTDNSTSNSKKSSNLINAKSDKIAEKISTDASANDNKRLVGGLYWSWPTLGKVIFSFKDEIKNKISDGLVIAGVVDQRVHAASDGKVVYAGNDVEGYDNLIIINHNEVYLTTYSYNKILLVKEGDRVKRGQKIAVMGQVAEKYLLNFEVRKNGTPVDPLLYLPVKDNKVSSNTESIDK